MGIRSFFNIIFSSIIRSENWENLKNNENVLLFNSKYTSSFRIEWFIMLFLVPINKKRKTKFYQYTKYPVSILPISIFFLGFNNKRIFISYSYKNYHILQYFNILINLSLSFDVKLLDSIVLSPRARLVLDTGRLSD